MLKFIHFITSLLLLVFATFASGQTSEKISISGQFQTEGISETIIYLMNADGKSLAKTEYADEKGNFIFSQINPGNYLINITQNGKPKYSGEIFEANTDVKLGILSANAAKTLNEVVVTKARPYIERQDGKMILNVENTIAATGSSAFEVLERAPGVNVDNNDNISLRGKTGIVVQIDGKPTPMTGANLANYLRGIPSGSVEKIEFITNPSSKYDAAGTSIINIKMKKDKRKGTNGSVSVAAGQGKYPKNNNTLSLNHRKGKINVFGNYSFAYREGLNDLQMHRYFYENDTYTGSYDQDNYLRLYLRTHNGRAGLDYNINDKHTLGIIVGGLNNRIHRDGNNFMDVYDAQNTKISQYTTNSRAKDNWRNYSASINYKYTIDTVGTVFTTDLDYANYGNTSDQDFNTDYFNFDDTEPLPQYRLHGNIKGGLDLYAVKSDFVTTLKNKMKIESGLKSSYVVADNDLAFYNQSLGLNLFDASKSNHFIYKENINAAYVNTSKEIGKWNFQLGLRLENTNISGNQVLTNTKFTDHYTQLFPSAFASYAINPTNSLEVNYSRRIQRPGYDQLNPFKSYLDPTTYKEGNPYLKPQTTHALEITHVLNQKIYTTLSFARTMDNITENISPSETEPNVTIQSTKNLKSVDVYSLAVIAPISITPWWESTNNFNFYVGSFSGTIANTTLSNSGNFTWTVNSVNTFKLGGGFSAELIADYHAKELYAFDTVKPIWYANSGLQKKFENKSVLKLAITDMFYTNGMRATVNFNNYREQFHVRRDTRVITLSYTYNFGNGNSGARKRTGGAEDIKQRAGSNG